MIFLDCVHERKWTSRKMEARQREKEKIHSRIRLLADDIVSFSIPLPFFIHPPPPHFSVVVFEIRGTKDARDETGSTGREEVQVCAVRRPLIDSEPPFSSIVPPSLVFQRLLVIFLLFVPGERGSLRGAGRGFPEASCISDIRSFVSSVEGRMAAVLSRSRNGMPLLLTIPSSSDRFVNPSCPSTCFEFYHHLTGDGPILCTYIYI